MCVQRDSRILFNAPDQISRHSVGQTIGSYEHVDVSRRLGEGHRSLSRRVAAANDANLFTGAQLRLDERGAVVHAGIFELRNILQRKLPVFCAGRNDDRTREDLRTVIGFDDVLPRVAPEPLCSLRDHQVRAEFQRLRVRARRQLLTRDPGGKPEVVLDPRARSGLSSRSTSFQHQHVEAFRCRVHSCGETRRSGSDDHRVVHLRLVYWLVETETISDIAIARIPQNDLAAADNYGDFGDGNPKSIQKLLSARITIEVDVPVRMAVSRQKFLNAKRFLQVYGSD